MATSFEETRSEGDEPEGAAGERPDATDAYAAEHDTTEGRVYTVSGGDWDELAQTLGEVEDERVVVNMGPQHPSTHGVLRLVLELEGETVTEARCGIGFLHTGIEKNLEYRSWTQGVTFVTRMDYLSNAFNEVVYCLGVEKLLGSPTRCPSARRRSGSCSWSCSASPRTWSPSRPGAWRSAR
jgi:NADH-quinone oxidoreductase subunit D